MTETQPPPREVVTTRLRPESRAKIAALAKKRGESVSATVRTLIAYAVDKMPDTYRLGG